MEKILEYYGLTATAFAAEINFNRSTISHILSGRNKPSLEFVLKVLQKFPEVEMEWLTLGKGTFPFSKNNTTPLPEKQEQSTQHKTMDLFSAKNTSEEKNADAKSYTNSVIDKIVIFYNDGTFKSYQN